MLKKFFKWSGIVAGILLAVGLAILFATSLMGGRQLIANLSKISLSPEMWDELEWNFEWDELDQVLEAVDGLQINVSEDNVSIGLNSEGSTDLTVNDKIMEGGTEETIYLTSQVNSLELSIGAGELVVLEKETDDGTITLSISGLGKCKHYVDHEGTLVVEGFKGNFGIVGIGDTSVNKIVLEVPLGMKFIEIDIEAGAGQIEMTDVLVGDLEAEIGAGKLALGRMTADEFSVTIGAGQMDAEEMNVKDAEINVSMGEGIFSGSITGNLEAECDMGNLDLELAGSQKEHNFQIECGAGNIDMEGFKMTGLSGERTIDNGSASEYEITCNLGNITLEFEAD